VFGRRGGGLDGGADKVIGPALVSATASSFLSDPGPHFSVIGLHCSPRSAAYKVEMKKSQIIFTNIYQWILQRSKLVCKVPPNPCFLVLQFN